MFQIIQKILTFAYIFISFFSGLIAGDNSTTSMVLISDTQEPNFIEYIVMEGHNNTAARDSIFNRILEIKPKALFHLGDFVTLGFSDSQWEDIDVFLQKLKQSKIPIYPALGNHEILFFANPGYKNFISRFPEFKETGYTKIVDSIAVVILNSNFYFLGDEKVEHQQKWYESEMKKLERDSSVVQIIVCCHHSPYTNSKIVSDNAEVRKHFLPAFTESKKSIIFLSGHSHNLEHFHYRGKDFLVIGGGGGMLQPRYKGDDSKFKDKIDPGLFRFFHYLTVDRKNGKTTLEVMMLRSNLSGFNKVYELKY